MIPLILFLFSQLAHSEEQCMLKNPGGLAKFAHTLAQPSYSMKKLILGDDDDSNDDDEYGNDNDYPGYSDEEEEDMDVFEELIGPIIFGAFYGFFAVVLFFWTLCTQCCACYECCKPVKSGKPSICIIVLFSIASALIFFSMIVLYTSASKFSKSFNDIVDLTRNFNGSYNNLVNKITDVVYYTFDSINDTTNQIKQVMTDLVTSIDTNSEKQRQNAQTSKEIIEEFVDSFRLSNDDGKNTKYKDLRDKFQDYPSLDNCIENVLDQTANIVIEIADKMIYSVDDFAETTKEIKNNLNGEAFNKITNQIQDGYAQVDGVIGTLDMVTDVISNLTDITDTISDYKSIVNFAVYFIPSFVLIFLVAYILSFIFKCCCSRCLLAWFHCFGFFVTLFVVFIGAIFAILFGALDTLCPKLLDYLIDDYGFLDGVEISSENKTQMFVCDETRSLLDLGLDSIIDLEDIKTSIKDAPEDLKKLVNFDGINDLQTNLGNFTEGNNLTEMITAKQIILNYDINLAELKKNQNNQGQKDIIDQILNLIEAKDDNLSVASSLMENVTNFAGEISAQINQTLNQTLGLSDFTENIVDNVNERLGYITCIDTRCVYSSIRNPFCENIQSATGLWAVAATTTIMGLMLMSCAICKRRRQFKDVVVSPNDEFEGKNQDLAGFAANDGLL